MYYSTLIDTTFGFLFFDVAGTYENSFSLKKLFYSQFSQPYTTQTSQNVHTIRRREYR